MPPRAAQRSFDILHALVREFIAHGEPVSSARLYDNYDFGIKPAMIRAELNDLTDRGYLEQPHHSAGRVPKDKAYEYFAEEALAAHARANMSAADALFHLLEERAWRDAAEKLAEASGLWGAVSAFDEDQVYKDGLEALVDRLDWHSRRDLTSVIRDFEAFDERVEQAKEDIGHDALRVFVGKKSPVTKSSELSVMVRGCRVDGDDVLLFAIGPKRMDYEKVAQIMKAISK